mgnify:CR=1 FL=1|jgi:mercuric ion binding protein
MKTSFLLLGLILSVQLAFSQSKNPGKAVISTPGAHCEICQKRIEGWVSRQYGVTSVKVDLKKKTTTVTWIPDRANIEDVKVYINNVGYDADNEEAEETAYFRLPKDCQTKNIQDTLPKRRRGE